MDGQAPAVAALPAPPADVAGTEVERRRFVALVRLFAELPPPPDPVGLYRNWGRLHGGLLAAMGAGDDEALEEAFLRLYAHLHSHAAPYTREERRVVDAAGGYWAHAGGISPVLKAPDFIGPASVSLDLGAGTGMQLLLLQVLAPHRRSIQVEISSRLVEAGRALQGWLGIPSERVEWRIEDVTRSKFPDCDLLYLYRPVRPDGPGLRFYERLAAHLAGAAHPVAVLSVADCLGQFLPETFERVYFDGHLACFSRREGTGERGKERQTKGQE